MVPVVIAFCADGDLQCSPLVPFGSWMRSTYGAGLKVRTAQLLLKVREVHAL